MKKLLIAFLLTTSFLKAQTNGEQTGFVYDEFGKLLSGAVIKVSESDISVTSDATGFFKLENIEPKSYNITATFTGFEEETKFNVIIKSAGNNDLVFNLKASVFQKLNEVVITKSPFKRKKETPLSIQSLSAVEITSYPGGNNDIAKVVQSLPGVSGSAGGFRNDIIIRGGAPNENVYYLDAIEIPNINHFSTQGSAGGPVGMLNVSFIDGVTLSSSAFESKYDNTLSGILQFNQRKGNNKKFQGNVRVSASEAGLTAEGPLFKGEKESSNTTYLLSVRRSYLQYLFQLIGLPVRPDYYDYQYKINHKIDNFNELNFIGIGSIDKFTVKSPSTFDIEQQSTLDQVPIINQWTTTSGLSWKRRFKDESGFMLNSVSTNILNNDFKRYTDNENQQGLFFTNISRETEIKFRNEITKNIDGFKIVGGLDVQKLKYENTTSNLNANVNYATKIDFVKYGFFGQTSKTIFNDKLDLSLGFRMDANSFTTEKNQLLNTFSPRFSVSYTLTEDKSWRVSASIGKYFKIQPYTILGYKDNTGNYVNKDAKYTNNTHYVIGISKQVNPTTQVSVEGFFKKYNNYAVSLKDGVSLANKGGDFEVLGNEAVITNGVGRTYGMELLYQQKLTKNFFGIFSYTLFKSEFTGLDNTYRPSVWDSRNLVSVTAGYKFKHNWETGLRYRFAGKTPFVPVNQPETLNVYPEIVLDYNRLGQEKLNNFSQLDVRLDKKWNFKKFAFNVYIDVKNILFQQIPEQNSFNLNRDPQTGAIINPRTLIEVKPTESTPIPNIGLILDF